MRPSRLLVVVPFASGCLAGRIHVSETVSYDDVPVSEESKPGATASGLDVRAVADAEGVRLTGETVDRCSTITTRTVGRTKIIARTLDDEALDQQRGLRFYGALGAVAGVALTGLGAAMAADPDLLGDNNPIPADGLPLVGLGLVGIGGGTWFLGTASWMGRQAKDSREPLGPIEVVDESAPVECGRRPLDGRAALEPTTLVGTFADGSWPLRLDAAPMADLGILSGEEALTLRVGPSAGDNTPVALGSEARTTLRTAAVDARSRRLAAMLADPALAGEARAAVGCSADESRLIEASKATLTSIVFHDAVFIDAWSDAALPGQPSLHPLRTSFGGTYHAIAFGTWPGALRVAAVLDGQPVDLPSGFVSQASAVLSHAFAVAADGTPAPVESGVRTVSGISFTAGPSKQAPIQVTGTGCYGVAVFYLP